MTDHHNDKGSCFIKASSLVFTLRDSDLVHLEWSLGMFV